MNFDEVVKKYPEVNFLQSPEYGKMNELLGDKVITSDFGGVGHALMIVRNALSIFISLKERQLSGDTIANV